MSSNPAHGEVYPIQHCDKVCQWLATGQWFSHGTAVSSTNKTDWHDVAKILLKVAFKPYNPTTSPNRTIDWLSIKAIFFKKHTQVCNLLWCESSLVGSLQSVIFVLIGYPRLTSP